MASSTNERIALSTKNRHEWSRPEFWVNKLPSFLTISGKGVSTSSNTIDKSNDKETGARRRQTLQRQGFALVDDAIADKEMILTIRQGIDHLQSFGLPASFILLFDVTWQLAQYSWLVLQGSTLETNQFQFDILAWYIDSEGFSPHRDRQPDTDTKLSFGRGGGDNGRLDAKFVTHWIALTEATPENSCLYVIPKDHDPGYYNGDSEEIDPLQAALPNKQAYQHIRALPRQAGQSVLFTHRIIHWGSTRDANTTLPCRTAISFVCSDPCFEKPYVNPKYVDFQNKTWPPFHIRLLLVCAQMLIYYQRFDLTKEFIKSCYEYCKEHEEELEESYRRKVFVEFVKAMKELKHTRPHDGGGDDDNEEEEEEAMMEEMLQAESKGYGEFADDYDEQFGGGDDECFDLNNDDDDDDEEEDDETLRVQFGKRGLFSSKDKKEEEVTNKKRKSS